MGKSKGKKKDKALPKDKGSRRGLLAAAGAATLAAAGAAGAWFASRRK